MILDVLCVITHYLPIIVCGNGRTQEERGHAFDCVVSETELRHKECGNTFLYHNDLRLETVRNVHVTMFYSMIQLFVTQI